MSLTKKSSYFYDLPKDLIAQHPVKGRSESRLLFLNRSSGEIQHKLFTDILQFMNAGDVLVLNNTKVIPARLFGIKSNGGKAEIFLLNQISEKIWNVLVRPGRSCHIGTQIFFPAGLTGTIIDYGEDQTRLIEFQWEGDFWQVLDIAGQVPLPPYIHHIPNQIDEEHYQTVYAKEKGSVAAPTAGLHFTPEILESIAYKGIIIQEVLLHVGLGTFRPVKTDSILQHKMHKEYCQILPETAVVINEAKKRKSKIIAVGTTSVRTLESFENHGLVLHGEHWTDLFMYPGKPFQIVDAMITNFHMPESTLLMLVSAFAGYDNIMNAYKIAIEERYRFFSYGDAMIII